MKKNIILLIALTSVMIIFAGFTLSKTESQENTATDEIIVIDIPDDIKAVIDKSCYACHNKDSKSDKAKLRLRFDKFTSGEYSPGKVIGKLNGIIETIDEGEMPPKKFLEKYPDKKLTKDDTELLKEWANKNIKKLTDE